MNITGFHLQFVVLKVFIFYFLSTIYFTFGNECNKKNTIRLESLQCFRLSIFLKIEQITCSLIPEQIGFGGKRCKILFVKVLGKPAGNILNNNNNRSRQVLP